MAASSRIPITPSRSIWVCHISLLIELEVPGSHILPVRHLTSVTPRRKGCRFKPNRNSHRLHRFTDCIASTGARFVPARNCETAGKACGESIYSVSQEILNLCGVLQAHRLAAKLLGRVPDDLSTSGSTSGGALRAEGHGLKTSGTCRLKASSLVGPSPVQRREDEQANLSRDVKKDNKKFGT